MKFKYVDIFNQIYYMFSPVCRMVSAYIASLYCSVPCVPVAYILFSYPRYYAIMTIIYGIEDGAYENQCTLIDTINYSRTGMMISFYETSICPAS